MKQNTIQFFLFILVLCGSSLMTISCSENDCSITRRPAARFTFYNSATNQAIVYPYDTLTVSAIRTPEEGGDTILLNRITSADYISLPLSYNKSETEFILLYREGDFIYRDTIRITHTNIPTFISMDCGRDMFFHIDDIYSTTNALENINLLDPDIRDHEKENIQIFFQINSL